MKQFEELHPLTQETIKEFKKIFEDFVFKDLSNVYYNLFDGSLGDGKFHPYIILNKSLSDMFCIENVIKTHLQIKYFFNKNYYEILNDCCSFLYEKNYFIKIPSKLKLYHGYWIADNS